MFVQVNKNYALNYDTWQFAPVAKLPKESTCMVPSPFWKYKDKDTHKQLVGFGKFNTFKLMPILQLHGLTVQIDSDHAAIRIQTKNGVKEFDLHWRFTPFGSNPGGGGFLVLDKVEYELLDGSGVSYHIYNLEHIFDNVSGLCKLGSKQFDNAEMLFGISENRLKVIYKEKELNSMMYALIYGPWAILLSDDMQFDSFVYLAGNRYGTLRIDKIVYTVNTYMLKLMLLA